MASIQIRPYRSGDETGIVSCWNRSCPQERIALRLFVRRVLLDANFDPSGLLVAEAAGAGSGSIVGFVIAIVRRVPLWGTDLDPDDGWITAFAVDPARRREGIARRLLKAADEFFRRAGRKRVSFSPYAPNYFVPGIDRKTYPAGAACLESHGFKRLYTCAAMDRTLVLYSMPAAARELEAARIAEGYRFEPVSSSTIAAAAAFARDEFHPDWGRAIREMFLQGQDFDQSVIAVSPDGDVVGFALYGAYDGILERFGPFGVRGDQRGKGLGKILLHKSLDAMRSRGLHTCWFLWTGENTPAGHLYADAGFQVTRRFDVMQKEL